MTGYFSEQKNPRTKWVIHTVIFARFSLHQSAIVAQPFVIVNGQFLLETEFWNHNGQISSGKEDALALDFGCVESFVLFLAFLLWYPIFWSVPIQGIVNSIHWENRHTCGIYFG